MPRSLTVVLLLAAAVVGHSSIAAQGDRYVTSIEAWRAEREARLTADDGWLTVAGLFFLREGPNTFGTDSRNDIVLPEGPSEAGVFERQGRRVTVTAAGPHTVVVNGTAVTSAPLYPREDRAYLTIGGLTLFVHLSGERLAIRMRDRNHVLRREFAGLRWYPVDETYRVTARFVPHPEPVTVQIQNILGDLERYSSAGSVVFTLHGEELRMTPVASGSQLWFIFRDRTSGTETYPAARFLYAEAPSNGRTVLDFNKAYNPPCAFNPHTTCPLPPLENRLPVRVEAGELDYHVGN